MKTYTEPQKQIPIIDEVDVLVVGGGPAGIGAAISAARNGASVMIIEQAGDVGGVATTGMMSHWGGITQGPIYNEIINKASDNDFGVDNPQIINTEKLKNTLLDMLVDAGVKIRMYTFASDVIKEGNNLKGVIIESKSGREAVLAKIVIDCSGDGDIAARAGAEYTKGREEDGKMQPMTLMFRVAGVDEDRVPFFPGMFEDNREVPKGKVQDLAKEYIPYPAGHILVYPTTIPGVITCNMTNAIGYDGTKAEDLTKAHCQCRSQMDSIVKYLRECIPGFEKCYIISSASIIGVRETRHFMCEKRIEAEDIINARTFDDWAVTRVHFNLDVHNLTGSGLDKTGCQRNFKQRNYYTIPYGCLVPVKIDNLLLAGRHISGSHMAHSSYRVMPICVNMGQAAGTAAALCVKSNIQPRELDVKQLQKTLTEQGVEV